MHKCAYYSRNNLDLWPLACLFSIDLMHIFLRWVSACCVCQLILLSSLPASRHHLWSFTLPVTPLYISRSKKVTSDTIWLYMSHVLKLVCADCLHEKQDGWLTGNAYPTVTHTVEPGCPCQGGKLNIIDYTATYSLNYVQQDSFIKTWAITENRCTELSCSDMLWNKWLIDKKHEGKSKCSLLVWLQQDNWLNRSLS